VDLRARRVGGEFDLELDELGHFLVTGPAALE
jgi:hypothetical protein